MHSLTPQMSPTASATRQPRHFASRALGALGVLALAAGALFATAAPAQAHDQIIDSVIENSADGEANLLRLTYNNSVLDLGTEIVITDETGTDATAGAPEVSGRDVTVPLNAPLADGTYTAVWRVVSSDGHPIDGGFEFDITDAAASPLRALDGAADDHEHEHDEDEADGHDHDHGTSDEAAAADTSNDESNADADSSSGIQSTAMYLLIGAGVVVIGIIAAVILRARRQGAARGDSPNSTDNSISKE